MRVRVLFFGLLKDVVGCSGELLEVPAGATVAHVLSHYGDGQRMRSFLPSLAISVNQEYASRDTLLREGDEIALLPPVSGGSSGTTTASRAALVRGRIDPQGIVDAMRQPSDGALVVFDGVVRDNSRGRRTLYLDYEAYEPMAERELERLAAHALRRFDVREIVVVHRLGRLEIGDTSVLIGVAAAHRAPAFDACRWMIDTLKKTVPIWKKEYFADGAVWADGEPFPPEIVATPPDRLRGSNSE